MAKRPSLAERQSRKEHGEGEEKEENKVIKSSMMRFEQEQQLRMAFSHVSPANT